MRPIAKSIKRQVRSTESSHIVKTAIRLIMQGFILWHKNFQIAQSLLPVSGYLRRVFENFHICTNIWSVSGNFHHVSGTFDLTKILYLFSIIWHNKFPDCLSFGDVSNMVKHVIENFQISKNFRPLYRNFSAWVRKVFFSLMKMNII